MPIKLNSTGGGSITIDVPNMSTANTLTLPGITGNVITSSDSNTITQTMINRSGFYGGFGPAFSAYYTGSGQSFTGGTQTKAIINTKEWDTANCFDTSNYRFTPNVAGYYHVIGELQFATAAYTNSVDFYKNGAIWKRGTLGTTQSPFASCLVYLNGSTDYIDLFAYIATTASTQSTQTYNNYFQGYLVRPA